MTLSISWEKASILRASNKEKIVKVKEKVKGLKIAYKYI